MHPRVTKLLGARWSMVRAATPLTAQPGAGPVEAHGEKLCAAATSMTPAACAWATPPPASLSMQKSSNGAARIGQQRQIVHQARQSFGGRGIESGLALGRVRVQWARQRAKRFGSRGCTASSPLHSPRTLHSGKLGSGLLACIVSDSRQPTTSEWSHLRTSSLTYFITYVLHHLLLNSRQPTTSECL